jgi:hypothetical protein
MVSVDTLIARADRKARNNKVGNETQARNRRISLARKAEAVEVIGIITWLDERPGLGDNYQETCRYLKEFLKDNPDTTYYAEPRESFFIFKAREIAARGGFTKVIVEDLS